MNATPESLIKDYASHAVAQVDQEVLVQAPFMLMRMLKFEAPVQDKTFEPEMFEVSLNKNSQTKMSNLHSIKRHRHRK